MYAAMSQECSMESWFRARVLDKEISIGESLATIQNLEYILLWLFLQFNRFYKFTNARKWNTQV
jgi:hypothetical protein